MSEAEMRELLSRGSETIEGLGRTVRTLSAENSRLRSAVVDAAFILTKGTAKICPAEAGREAALLLKAALASLNPATPPKAEE